MSKLEMTAEELASFLGEYQHVAVASLRKDGSPNVIPLGYVYDGTFMYLSIGKGRGLIARVRRDPRVCITCFNNQWPVRFAVVHGKAEIIEDPDDRISRQICYRHMSVVPGIDYERYEKNWLSHGRAVIRMKIENAITFDAGHAKGFVY